jgi:hypothetical protein
MLIDLTELEVRALIDSALLWQSYAEEDFVLKETQQKLCKALADTLSASSTEAKS